MSAGWPAPLAARHEGRIVVVEPLAAAHGDGLFAAAQQSEWTWMPTDPSGSRDRFAAWFAEALEASEAGLEAAHVILDRATGEPIGSTRFLELRPEHAGLEIGWTWLAQPAWQTGANVETKLLLLSYAFDVLCCERVELKTDARNMRSRGAMEALPAQFEGIHRHHRRRDDGSWRDSAWFSVIAPEWQEVRVNLQRRLRR